MSDNNESTGTGIKQIMYDAMLVDVVGETLRKQYRISASVASYHLYGYLGGDNAYLRPAEYNRLRRGVRWVLTRAGFDGKTVMTDEILKGILKTKLRIVVREVATE